MVTIPQTFVDFEGIDKGQKWFFMYSLGGSIMVFTKNPQLSQLREELEKLLELIDYKEKTGLTTLTVEDGGRYY